MTAYEYDEDGRLVGAVTTTEPEWSPADYAQMQALAIYEASLCPGCSRPIDICAADYESKAPISVDRHVCSYELARAVQARLDEWENLPAGKRASTAPLTPQPTDGLMYAPRPSTPDELSQTGR